MTPFWTLEHGGTAVITAEGTALSYQALAERADALAQKTGGGRQLWLLKADNTLPSLLVYLAALRHGHVLMLQPPSLSDEAQQRLLAAFDPNRLFEADGQSIERHHRQLAMTSDLALLLTTSGSTGSPRQVMLSASALEANAQSICQALPIEASDKAITALPCHYSYGLSVINSHLAKGACLVLSQDSVLSRPFWDCFKAHGITSLAGVPASYEMLLKLRFERMALPALRYLTQAGGRLEPALVQRISQLFAGRASFHVMYGQTEATARMACLPPELAQSHSDAIGRAIPGGEFGLRRGGDDFAPVAGDSGELLYRGANVMLGYAEHQGDLANPERPALLATGDLALYLGDGLYRITGRLKRMVKLQGNRTNLDELQAQLGEGLTLAITGQDDKLCLTVTDASATELLAQRLRALGIHSSLYRIKLRPALPMTASGKIDYKALDDE